MRRVEGEDVVEMEHAFGRAGIVGEQAHQPGAPSLVNVAAEAGHEIAPGADINLVRLGRRYRFQPLAEALDQLVEYGLQRGGNVHGPPPRMRAVCCTIW